MTVPPERTVVRVLHEARHATLATLEAGGGPYASLVAVAPDHDGTPVLFLSNLARHTRNIAGETRASVLVSSRSDDPLAAPRASLLGRVVPAPGAQTRSRYLAWHPEAALYADFPDFAFYRLEVEEVHLVEGFGRISTLPGTVVGVHWEGAEDVRAAEADIVAHMNAEHSDAVELYATRILSEEQAGWRMIGLDPAGCDLSDGARVRRLDFPAPAKTVAAVREVLVAIAKSARE